ncbi:hypothetical protein JCM6882_007666 [Rhodosporidiobolus microsporus]
MAALPEIQSVTQLSRYVTRILGFNPSKFTLQGTNSYLVHHPSSPSLLLLDTTGPSSSAPLPPSAQEAYLSSLRSAILSHPVQPATVTDIILTHWHQDHVGAVRSVVEMLAEMQRQMGEGRQAVRVWKMPCAEEEGTGSSGKRHDQEIAESLVGLSGKALLPSPDGKSVHPLRDGQRFRLARVSSEETEDDVELQVVSTPGHTSDSICLALSLSPPQPSTAPSDSSPSSRLLSLFTADTVLGHGTAVFASLSHYLRSLASLVDLLKDSPDVPLYPGHGEVVQKGLEKVREYKSHREERERQVVEALGKVEEGKSVTASDLTDQIYGSTIPSSLKPAATHGLLLHLAKLAEEDRVERISSSGGGGGAATTSQGKESHGEVVIPQGWNDGWRWTGGKGSGVSEAAARM